MITKTFIITALVFFLFSGCVKSSTPKITFFEALEHIEINADYDFDFSRYSEYKMDVEFENSTSKYGAASSWTVVSEDFSWYIQNFRVRDMGVSALINIARDDNLAMILDISTFYREGKRVYFGTLWEPVYPPGSQGELPYRLGVYFYSDPEEVKIGTRIKPDYIIDMKDRKLWVHEPDGEDKKLFLYQDPNPM